MDNILSTIDKYNLIAKGDVVAVACSGGKDSMALLHYLWNNRESIGCEVVAVNIDHCIRKASSEDSAFVSNYCKKHGIKLYSHKVDAVKYSQDNKLTIEQGARDCRYKVFASLVEKKLVNKIALAHHLQDQAETILLNLFRGTGISGASGMDYIRDNMYIRPMLNTAQASILAYLGTNEIPYVEDETNHDNDYSRNYIRNKIMPLVRFKWPSADRAIANFGKNCKQDESYIQSTISESAILPEEGLVRINFGYFVYPDAYVFRLILKALKRIGITSNVETKHLKMIKNMALEAENGTKINLADGLTVIKEYNYITFTNRRTKVRNKTYEFKRGKLDISGYGLIDTNVTKKFDVSAYTHLVDISKLPKDAVWRFRKDGDTFEKFGGGTKSLSDYLIDKKVPVRLRANTPVLAKGGEIYIIAGVEISDKIKVDKNTKSAYGINVKRF
ncbi:MAG: tRNA lysidine(34) synthetase TilS [Clostridiales bacterium]|nr:tRNA lysidine(34) synthetase TilS [Clostridiales bacterium]